MAWCLCWKAAHAVVAVANPDAFIEQTQRLATVDHPRFLRQLALLNREASGLTPDQRWHLRYSNAWEAMYESDYARSGALFQDIIRHSGNANLADRASAMLLAQYGLTRRYMEAFELADRLVARLPQVTDAKVRLELLVGLSQAMGLAGQTDLAVNYARMAMAAAAGGNDSCYAVAELVTALFNGHELKPGSPELQQALTACPAALIPVYHTGLTLMLVNLYARGGQPRKALALLDSIQPSIDANGYVPSRLNALGDRAWALAALGEDAAARRAALAVIAASPSSSFDMWLKDACDVLYRIEKKQGNFAAALAYHEKFSALDTAWLDDANARALAYETVQQRVLAQKLETEKLSEQNARLLARQALDTKATETDRLYLALLLMALGFGALWMLRLKRSQMRFKRLSHLDGLTAIYNRQHFMGEAGRALRQSERRRGEACLAIIDLDHFKRVNDTCGHMMGDEVLRRVVDACKQHLRPIDVFGRLGGEEFGILLADCTRGQGMAIAERMRAAVEATVVELDDVTLAVSASIGLAFTAASGHDMRQLCIDADAALYCAKHAGRNRVMAGRQETVAV